MCVDVPGPFARARLAVRLYLHSGAIPQRVPVLRAPHPFLILFLLVLILSDNRFGLCQKRMIGEGRRAREEMEQGNYVMHLCYKWAQFVVCASPMQSLAC